VAAVNPSPARGPVTLLANRTAATPALPVQLPAPAQPTGVAAQVNSPAADQSPRRAGGGYPAPAPHAEPPAPRSQPPGQSEYEREQLARLAQLLAQSMHNPGGTTPTSGSLAPTSPPPVINSGAGPTFRNSTPAATGGSSGGAGGYSNSYRPSGGASGVNASTSANRETGASTVSHSGGGGSSSLGVSGRGGGSSSLGVSSRGGGSSSLGGSGGGRGVGGGVGGGGGHGAR
jgi:hypothetical protein